MNHVIIVLLLDSVAILAQAILTPRILFTPLVLHAALRTFRVHFTMSTGCGCSIRNNRWNRTKSAAIAEAETTSAIQSSRKSATIVASETTCYIIDKFSPATHSTPAPPSMIDLAPLVPPAPPPPSMTDLAMMPEQVEFFNKADEQLNGCIRNISIVNYISEFGPMTKSSPFGIWAFEAMSSRWKDYLYRYQFGGGCMRLGVFNAPYHFSKAESALALKDIDVDQKTQFPTIWQQYGEGDSCYIVCQNILMRQSRPWLVHVSRVMDGCEMPK